MLDELSEDRVALSPGLVGAEAGEVLEEGNTLVDIPEGEEGEGGWVRVNSEEGGKAG